MVSIILRYNDLFKYDSPTELRSWKTRTGFIHSFIQYLLSIYYEPGTSQGTVDTEINKKDKILARIYLKF